MKVKRPEIKLSNIQIKSEESFHRLCSALVEIEEQCGIKETRITLKGVFFCPWIKKNKCKNTPMEKLIISLL